MNLSQKLQAFIMLICLSAVTGCVMQNSVEVSGGFFDGETQGGR